MRRARPGAVLDSLVGALLAVSLVAFPVAGRADAEGPAAGAALRALGSSNPVVRAEAVVALGSLPPGEERELALPPC